MKNLALILILSGLIFSGCKKETSVSQNLLLLTSHIWTSDSLLIDKVDASGPGMLLEKFKGDMKFDKGGTGTFGIYTGTWWFSDNETDLVIVSEGLGSALTANIIELKSSSLKITTNYPNPVPGSSPLNIRMTFKPK